MLQQLTGSLGQARALNRHQSVKIQCSASSNAGSGNGGAGRNIGHPLTGKKKARQPGLFEIKVVTPPPRSLGIYALPPLTHNGEEIEVDGAGYVVTSVVVQYKLLKGKYVRDHNRLEVQPTGRWLLNQQLDQLLRAKYVGPTGLQD
eukprot:CAMPEP_0202892960 /NCGR_PEP_ID=MMETSP1392-20130828/2628_1 /ASSEMBLY_ACC=CAM_ASM_000868 /TAXON_ID=225041 /ORGANISM="Chlamydomonas chlamydogama, Strain SAG 11-48b" /LENGTH=145 /DNA_ID=CAMNT_0049577109 /DNA_START=120 /DNA_END=557 /DNA_ORIENTATION=-